MTDKQIKIKPETDMSNKQELLQMNIIVSFSEHQ